MNFGEYKSRLQVTKANFYHMILRPAYQNEEFYSIISIQGSHMQSLTAYFYLYLEDQINKDEKQVTNSNSFTCLFWQEIIFYFWRLIKFFKKQTFCSYEEGHVHPVHPPGYGPGCHCEFYMDPKKLFAKAIS